MYVTAQLRIYVSWGKKAFYTKVIPYLQENY